MKKKGFTLIEVVIAAAMLFMVLGAVYTIFDNNIKIAAGQKKKAYIDSSVKSLMDQINQSMQVAYQDKIICTVDSISVIIPQNNDYTSSDQGNRIDLSYKLEGDSIRITRKLINGDPSEPPVEDNTLKGYIKGFKVEDPGTVGIIKITLTVEYGGRDADKEFIIYYKRRTD